MTEIKTCPKCGSEMVREQSLQSYGPARLLKYGDILGDTVVPFYCKHCGYIELYNEKNLKK